MVAVPDRLMTATGSVNVSVRFVNGVFVVHRLATTSLPEPGRWRKRRAEQHSRCSLCPPVMPDQNDALSPSCQLRASPAVAVILPKALLVGVVFGVEKLVWLNAL